jgi:RNA polymerase sigma-70 factor (ECF subfamily)
MASDEADLLLVDRVRSGDATAWSDLIARFEGRLLAFVESRLRNRATSEDVVQETFLGFLISLPNYNPQTPLESFLFSIAAHKLTDVLRREGRRPAIPLLDATPDGDPATRARGASTLVRSQERRGLEDQFLYNSLKTLIDGWIQGGEFERLKCMELLFVLGWSNKSVALQLGISEQAVANHKHAVITKLKEAARRSTLPGISFDDLGLNEGSHGH